MGFVTQRRHGVVFDEGRLSVAFLTWSLIAVEEAPCGAVLAPFCQQHLLQNFVRGKYGPGVDVA